MNLLKAKSHRIPHQLFTIILFFSLAVFLYAIWIRFGTYYFIDSYLPFNPKLDRYIFSFPWLYVAGHGEPFSDYIVWRFLTFPFYVGYLIGLSVELTQMLLFVSVLFLSGYGTYLLFLELFPKSCEGIVERVAFLGVSCVYMCNFYVIYAPLYDNQFLWFVYSLSPWFIISVLKGYKYGGGSRRMAWFIITLLISIPIAFFFIVYPAVPALLFLISVYIFLIIELGEDKFNLVGRLKYVSLVLLGIISVNFWIVGFFVSSVNANIEGYSTNNTWYWVFQNMQNTSQGISAYFFPSPTAFSVVSGRYMLSPLLLLIPFFETLPIYLWKNLMRYRNRNAYIATILFLFVSESMIAGLSGPFRWLLIFLIGKEFLPMISIQNVWYVFGFSSVILFVLCIGFVIDFLSSLRSELKNNSKLNKKVKGHCPRSDRKELVYVITLLTISLVLISSQYYAWTPSAVPSESGVSAVTTFPGYYKNFANFVESNLGNHLVLGLPVGAGLEGLNWTDNRTGFIANSPLKWWAGAPSLIDGQVSGGDQNILFNVIYPIVTASDTHNFSRLLSAYNIKYVVLQNNFIHNWPGGPAPFNLSHLRSFLSNQSDLLLVKKFGPLWLYLNTLPTNIIGCTLPTYFNPTLSNPIGKFNSGNLNTSYYSSFSKQNNEVSLDGQVFFEGHLLVNNSTLSLTLRYVNVSGAESAAVFYAAEPLNMSTAVYNYIVVNYTSQKNTSLQIAGTSEYAGGNGGFYKINTPPNNIDGSNTIIFHAPFHINPLYLRLFIFVSNPQNNTNYSIIIHSMYIAKYVNFTDYPLYILSSPNSSAIPSVLQYNFTKTQLAEPKHLQYTEVNPTLYEVTVDSTSPYYLYFAQTFDSNWKLVGIDGQHLNSTHLLVDGSLNGWIVSKYGSYSFYIEFKTRNLYPSWMTYAVTIIGTVSILACLFKDSNTPLSRTRRGAR